MARPFNIAHRGGAGLWPENTLFALENAARAGYDGAEIDVQLTKDGRLACFHDFKLKPELCRGPDGSWLTRREARRLPPIWRLTYEDLSAFDVGRVKLRTAYARLRHPRFPKDGERIPLLGEMVETTRALDKRFSLFIEIKTCPEDRTQSAAPEVVAEAIVHELRRLRFVENAVLVSFDWPALIYARALEPQLPCWFTTRRRRYSRRPQTWAGGFDPARFGGSIAEAIRHAGGQGWCCARQQATAKAIEDARRCGLKFGVWTVNGKREMRALKKLGADAIISDRPDRLAETLHGTSR